MALVLLMILEQEWSFSSYITGTASLTTTTTATSLRLKPTWFNPLYPKMHFTLYYTCCNVPLYFSGSPN
jgi:hypothetical protein